MGYLSSVQVLSGHIVVRAAECHEKTPRHGQLLSTVNATSGASREAEGVIHTPDCSVLHCCHTTTPNNFELASTLIPPNALTLQVDRSRYLGIECIAVQDY